MCGCKALRVLRIHIRLRSHKGLDDRRMAFEACIIQRCPSQSIENDEYEEWEVTER
jgi:hypothetical protein